MKRMVAFVGLHLRNYVVHTWVAFEGRGVERQTVEEVADPPGSILGVLECDTSNEAVHLVTLLNQELG